MFGFKVYYDADKCDDDNHEPVLTEFYFDLSKLIAIEAFDKSLPQDFIKTNKTPIKCWIYLEGQEPILCSFMQNDVHYMLYYLKHREMLTCDKLANDIADLIQNKSQQTQSSIDKSSKSSDNDLPLDYAVMLKRTPRPEYTAEDIAKIQNCDKDWVKSHQEDLAEIAKVAKDTGVQIVLDLDNKDKLAN